MGNYNFADDLEVSRQTEYQIGQLLEQKMQYVVKSYNDNAKYDILVEDRNGVPLAIEIKEDFMSAKTGNVAVEFSCRGKPSGIESSESHIYIYKIWFNETDFGVYWMPTERLKGIIKDKNYFRIVSGGDKGSNTQMYLFRLNEFEQHCLRLA